MLIFIPRGGESNNFDLTSSCKKLSKQILLSNIVASLLFSSSFALPSGGKFTHGTSGSISINGKEMNIAGNKQNSIIQWGGGFNIGKGESVNFGGKSQNYLNIAHGTSKSTIEGLLNANGKNVFLINPNGVIITKTGTINANRFVASTSSMSDGDMTAFANMKNFNDGLSFSPIFKPHKAGNVVNMGNINANNVLLIGNKVDIQGGKLGNEKSKTHLVGNKVFVDFGKSIIQSDYNFISALDKSHVYISSVDYYNNVNKYNKANFVKGNYLTNAKNIEKFVSIGSDIDWWHFAKGWNENEQFRNTANEYRLINSIDFGGNQGKNYANYCIDGLGCTSMIVGNGDNRSYLKSFDKSFDGQGYTLKNINIDATVLSFDENMNVGLFGSSKGAVFKNINIDYMNGSIKSNGDYNSIAIGSFVGYGENSKFDKIKIYNINNIEIENNINGNYRHVFVGGFSGQLNRSNVSNIEISNINKIYGKNIQDSASALVGGFVGSVAGGSYSNIKISNINSIVSKTEGGVAIGTGNASKSGGFAGQSYGYDDDYINYKNIIVSNIKNIYSEAKDNQGSFSGGFIGDIAYSESDIFSNIVVDNISNIIAIGGKEGTRGGKMSNSGAGGFSGNIGLYYVNDKSKFSDIKINNIELIKSSGMLSSAGGFTADIHGGIYNNISVSNIKEISSDNNINGDPFGNREASSGGFSGNIASGEFGNIVITNIGSIFSNTMQNDSYSGIFVGNIESPYSNRNFSNIFIYISDNHNIRSNSTNGQSYIGKFYGNLNGQTTFNNIHVYHKAGELGNAVADQNSWGNTLDKINIHTYTNTNSGYTDFENKVSAELDKDGLHKDKDGNLVFTKDFNINSPSKPTTDPDVVLESDDVISAKDLNQWLDEIFAGNYWVDIKDLDKIQGLSESIIQSISFLEALYGQEGMKEILEKFHNDYKTAYSKYDKFKTNKAELLAFINDKLKPLVDSSNKALDQLKIIQEQLKTAIAKYNDYVKKVNENPAIKNEETLNALKAQVDKLNQISGELATTIAKNQITLKDWQDKASDDSNGQFTIKGQFDNVALLIPDLEKVTTNGNENDEYQKISRQIANLQKQTPTFEYEEEETEEVEEASLNQKNKACIVSDNFKTMNPCVVGSF
ncbi:two-partner secretion domain-containing protein [Campylobacter lari]|uniref:Hemagglutinin domain-containing protein n=1 Tax=Campylobacter lari NCTC 11845 TaxID=1388749 RepID=A0A0A8HZU0_CAMLA|nr:filamentous hemagglutinin N-terminal domain-containing protein [Campylobacter lari]AJD02325.1 hemagglutinin domain-containing protein [Campylobacter lari NCTC 11845]